MQKIAVAVAALATLLALSASAEGAEFGDPGVVNVAAATSLDLTFGLSKAPGPGGQTTITQFAIRPSVDVFVAEGVSVGALVGYVYRGEKKQGASETDRASTFILGPRVGYNLWLSSGCISLWPLLGFEYQSTSTRAGGLEGPTYSKGTLDLFVPVVFHPVKHFQLAVGPYFSTDAISKAKPPSGDAIDGDKDTLFGLRGEIAGWL